MGDKAALNPVMRFWLISHMASSTSDVEEKYFYGSHGKPHPQKAGKGQEGYDRHGKGQEKGGDKLPGVQEVEHQEGHDKGGDQKFARSQDQRIEHSCGYDGADGAVIFSGPGHGAFPFPGAFAHDPHHVDRRAQGQKKSGDDGQEPRPGIPQVSDLQPETAHKIER